LSKSFGCVDGGHVASPSGTDFIIWRFICGYWAASWDGISCSAQPLRDMPIWYKPRTSFCYVWYLSLFCGGNVANNPAVCFQSIGDSGPDREKHSLCRKAALPFSCHVQRDSFIRIFPEMWPIVPTTMSQNLTALIIKTGPKRIKHWNLNCDMAKACLALDNGS